MAEKINELVVIAEKSGLPEERVKSLVSTFVPNLLDAEKIIKEARRIKVTDEDQVEDMASARELRLQLKGIRIHADKTREALKKNALLEGNAIQGMFNIIKATIVPVEDHLLEQEKFAELQEEKRKEERHSERIESLSKYVEDVSVYNLYDMEEEAYATLLDDVKTAHEKQIAAKKQEEINRLAAEKAKKKEQERIKKENEELKKKQEEIDARNVERNEELKPFITFIRDYGKLLNAEEAEYQKEFSDIKRGAKEHHAFEKKKEVKRIKDQEAAAEKFKKEREKKEALEAQIRAKKEKEEEGERLKAEKEKAALRAPDKDKLLEAARMIKGLRMPIVTSEEAQEIVDKAEGLLSKTATYVLQQAGKL